MPQIARLNIVPAQLDGPGTPPASESAAGPVRETLERMLVQQEAILAQQQNMTDMLQQLFGQLRVMEGKIDQLVAAAERE